MSREPAEKQYFVLTARALIGLPRFVSRLKPEKLVICRSSIEALKNHRLFRGHPDFLDTYIAYLVSRGARILESEGPRSWQWWSLFPVDRRPEIAAFKAAHPDSSTRFFAVGVSSRGLAKGEEAPLKVTDWGTYLGRVKGDTESFRLGTKFKESSRVTYRAIFLKILFNIFIAYSALLIGGYLFDSAYSKQRDYNKAVLAISIFSIGVLIYLWRERSRLSYGIFEVMIGTAISYNVFTTSNFLAESMINVANLQLAAGLYAIVRGMDNVGKSLNGTALERPWSWIFEGRSSRGDSWANVEADLKSNKSERVDAANQTQVMATGEKTN